MSSESVTDNSKGQLFYLSLSAVIGLFLVAMTVFVITSSWEEGAESDRPSRGIAQSTSHLPYERVKMRVPISIDLSSTAIPESGETEVQVDAIISAQSEFSGDLQYEWILPSDVRILNGNMTDTIQKFSFGNTQKISIVVTGFNKEFMKHISLMAHYQVNGSKMGYSAVLPSQQDQTLEHIVMKKAKR